MIETQQTYEPICPYCGQEQSDSWEMDFGGIEGTIELDCKSCEREFTCTKTVIVHYSTDALDEEGA